MQPFGNGFSLRVEDHRLHLVFDARNPKASGLAKRYKKFVSQDPNLIMVVGGDGFMLESLRKYHSMRLPFFGLNAGHDGFLLNDPAMMGKNIPQDFKIYNLPILEVEAKLTNGRISRTIGFNDAWVEKINRGQAAWIRVKVNKETRLEKLVADAALIATPAGSTAYARSMGASPVPLDGQVLVLAASSVFKPFDFRPCYLPIWSTVEFESVDDKKRPLFGIVDGVHIGVVKSMKVNVSRVASVQLANAGEYGLPEKLLARQFPRTD